MLYIIYNIMSIYDNYESFPGNNNTWGGSRPLTKYNRFVREYFKKAPNPTLSKAAKAYKSTSCKKTYTNCKKKSTRSKSCKGYTTRLTKLKSKTAKTRLRKKCKGYKKGKGMMGGDCAICRGTGEGLYGGCDCCGGSGIMEMEAIDGMGVFGGVGPKTKRRSVGTKATYDRLEDIGDQIRGILPKTLALPDGPEFHRQAALLNRYRGAYRQMLSLYNRQNNIGDKFIEYNRNDFADNFPGYRTKMAEFGRPYEKPRL